MSPASAGGDRRRRRRKGWVRSYMRSLPALLGGVRRPAAVAARLLAGGGGPVRVELRCGLVLQVRSALELWVVKETVLDRQYVPAGIAVGPDATVLDVGASIGDFAVDVARTGPGRTVHAFEPEPSAAAMLEENVRANGVRNVRLHRVAVAERDGPRELAVDHGRPVLNALDPPPGDPRPRIVVPCRRLDRLLDELGIVRCDLLKIDCEGAEEAILAGAGAAGLRSIAAVSLEYHGPGAASASRATLAEAGFRVWSAPCPVWEGQGLLHAVRDGVS